MVTQTATLERTETTTSKIQVKAKENPPSSRLSRNEKPQKAGFLVEMVGFTLPPLSLSTASFFILYYRSIPAWDVFFSVAFPFYLALANRFRFDNNAKLFASWKRQGKVYSERPDWFVNSNDSFFKRYLRVCIVIALILPMLLQFFAPTPIANASVPHLYLLLCQIALEHMANNPRCHPSLQLMTPIGFSFYRLAALKTWLVAALAPFPLQGFGMRAYHCLMVTESGIWMCPETVPSAWEAFHILLALSNVILWTYNTFVMLFLRILPPCLDQNKFLDADVSWGGSFQLFPTLQRNDSAKEAAGKSD